MHQQHQPPIVRHDRLSSKWIVRVRLIEFSISFGFPSVPLRVWQAYPEGYGWTTQGWEILHDIVADLLALSQVEVMAERVRPWESNWKQPLDFSCLDQTIIWCRLINPDCKVKTVLETQYIIRSSMMSGMIHSQIQDFLHFRYQARLLRAGDRKRNSRFTAFWCPRLIFLYFLGYFFAIGAHLPLQAATLLSSTKVVIDAIDGVANKCRLIHACHTLRWFAQMHCIVSAKCLLATSWPSFKGSQSKGQTSHV